MARRESIGMRVWLCVQSLQNHKVEMSIQFDRDNQSRVDFFRYFMLVEHWITAENYANLNCDAVAFHNINLNVPPFCYDIIL